MTYDPDCPGCRIARQITAGAMTLLAVTVPLYAAQQTGWHLEEPPRDGYRPDPHSNTSISASASADRAASDLNAGWFVIRIDQVPDRRDR